VKTLKAFNASNGADRMELIEKMITSLDGNRLLISELGIVLPTEYIIEIQQDAVVIKVNQLFNNLVIYNKWLITCCTVVLSRVVRACWF